MKIGFLCIALLSCSTWVNASTYCNPRFQFCVDYPSSLKTQYPESINGDGRIFKLVGSKADIRAYGTHAPGVFYDSDQQYLASLKSEYSKENSITYQKKKQNSYTISGYTSSGNIFYDHIVVKNREAIVVHFDYPVSEKDKMNEMIKQMSSSLRFK